MREAVVEFRILGPVEVIDRDKALALGGQKQRAVLAALLIDAGRVVSTDYLVDALWGEQPPKTAATSLQNFVSQLRKALGPEVLVTKPPGYQLRLEPGQLDLDRFTRLVEEARGAGAGGALGHAPEGARALAWRAVRRLHLRVVRPARDRAAERATAVGARGADRRRPRGRAATPSSSASWSRSSPSIRCASGCARS